MSFLDKVPDFIKDVQAEIDKLSKERVNINWGHECDCKYCDREGDGADQNAEEVADMIDKRIKEARGLIRKLEGYAKMWGVDIDAAA